MSKGTGHDEEFLGTERFRILRRLGAGGAGVVYEAYDRDHGVRLALKVLRRLEPNALLRFKNEFRSLEDLQHPNLVTLGELFESDGKWFFTMEFVEGVDFLSYVRRPGAVDTADPEATRSDHTLVDPPHASMFPIDRTPNPDFCWVPAFDEKRLRSGIQQLARGLAALHAAGKIHRDVKPSNVLVTPEGRVIILDFGLVLDASRAAEEAESDLVVGTMKYMAPEQAAGLRVDARADCYSAGVVLYRALTTRFPFDGASADLLLAQQRHKPIRPCQLSEGVPADLDLVCVDLLHMTPELRPSALDVLRRLNARATTEDSVMSALPSLARHFVGRELELAIIREAFDETLRGGAVAVAVSGDSGVGKSALARRFGELVADECNAVVLAGRCYERESVPYKGVDGVIDALSRYLARLPTPEVVALLPARAPLLAQVFPVLRRVPALAHPRVDPAEPPGPRELRSQLFAALRELMTRIAERLPLVVVIDDIQWSDADSLAFLRELTRPPDAPSVLLLTTARPGAAIALPGDVRAIDLDRLPPPEARELALLLMRQPTGATRAKIAEEIAREAGGHPLFIDELVRHAMLSGDGPAATLRLDDALLRRVGRLEASLRLVVELVAVAGAPIKQEVACRAAGMEYAPFVRAVKSLGVANLVRTTGSHAQKNATVEAYHDRVRDAVATHLSEDARREWHRLIALAMEEDQDADVDALAANWRRAGQPEKAAPYALLAGDKAASSLAFDRAARLYRMALTLGITGPAARAVQAKLGDALANAGRGGEAAAAFLALVGGASAVEALDLQRRAAEQLLISGHLDEGLATLKTVLTAMGMDVAPTTASAILSLLVRRAKLRVRGLGFKERDASQVPAESLRLIDSLSAISMALGMVDTLRGADFQTRHLLLALEAGEPNRVARALSLEASFVATGGSKSASRAGRIVLLAKEVASRAGHPLAEAWALGGEAATAFLQGRWAEALLLFERSGAILRERCSGVAWELDSSNFYQLGCLMHLGQLQELARRIPRLLEEAEQRGDRYALTHLRTGVLSIAWLARGDSEGARREAQDAIRSWSQRGTHLPHFLDVLAQAQIDLYEGKARDAHARVEQSWDKLERAMLLRVQFIRVKMLELRARAALSLAGAAGTGEAERARCVAIAERAARALEREGARWALPLAALIRAALLPPRRREDATALWERAASQFATEQMALHAAVASWRAGEAAADPGRVELARAWLRGQGVQEESKLVSMLAPTRFYRAD